MVEKTAKRPLAQKEKKKNMKKGERMMRNAVRILSNLNNIPSSACYQVCSCIRNILQKHLVHFYRSVKREFAYNFHTFKQLCFRYWPICTDCQVWLC